MKKTVLIILILAVLFGLSYLVTTAITAFIVWAISQMFDVHFGGNIWLLSLVVWLVVWVLQSIFGND